MKVEAGKKTKRAHFPQVSKISPRSMDITLLWLSFGRKKKKSTAQCLNLYRNLPLIVLRYGMVRHILKGDKGFLKKKNSD
jgi:hypothetical protein